MHKQSLELMKYFRNKYLTNKNPLYLQSVLDVGSRDINGSNRDLFKPSLFTYTGLDIKKGKNVDIIAKSPYNYRVLPNTYEIIISSQTLEHIEAPWIWILELKRLLKDKGFICIIAPHTIREHRYPLDCWRILPDGMRYLLGKYAKFKILEIKKGEIDTMGIAQKV